MHDLHITELLLDTSLHPRQYQFPEGCLLLEVYLQKLVQASEDWFEKIPILQTLRTLISSSSPAKVRSHIGHSSRYTTTIFCVFDRAPLEYTSSSTSITGHLDNFSSASLSTSKCRLPFRLRPFSLSAVSYSTLSRIHLRIERTALDLCRSPY